MQGPIPEDPVCTDRPVEPATPALARGTEGLRIAVAGGYFRKGDVSGSRASQCSASPRRSAPTRDIEIPEAQRARAAAYVITASEGASLHLRAAAHARRPTTTPRCATG